MPEEDLLEMLVEIEGIGEHYANLITDNRPYSRLSHIKQLEGVGDGRYEAVKKYFRVKNKEVK